MCGKNKPTLAELEQGTADNWKALYKRADEDKLFQLAVMYDKLNGASLHGMRAKVELFRRERMALWYDRGITILIAIATTLVTLTFDK